jgi:hypothetical protein
MRRGDASYEEGVVAHEKRSISDSRSWRVVMKIRKVKKKFVIRRLSMTDVSTAMSSVIVGADVGTLEL